MGLYFKAQLQQMWSKLSDELDVLDDHTQIASRAGEDREKQQESRWNTVFIRRGGGGHQLE